MRKKPINIRYKALAKELNLTVGVIESRLGHSIVPYDQKLLERAYTQWRLGDWQSLAQLEGGILAHHPDRAVLALLAAVGRLQTDQFFEAKRFIRLAQEWGVGRELACRILATGVHNSLGRAIAISGNFSKARKHFECAIAFGTLEYEKSLGATSHFNQQHYELETSAPDFGGETNSEHSTQTCFRPKKELTVTQLAEHNLGDAWAGNTINTVIFRHHGILTHLRKQTTAFYIDEHTLRLVQRDLETESILNYDMDGEYHLNDAHNSISLGVDRKGHLHICYGHHATRLRYRRSSRPNDITGWSNELPMTDMAEERVTYPTFLSPHHGFPLTLLYRDGVHNKGVALLKTYDEASESWKDHPQPILSGNESKPWTSNAYWNHPAIGRDGALHLSFVWRTHALGQEKLLNNINISYASSPDNGFNWVTSKGQAYQLPITPVNTEIIYPVSPGSNLINQCSMALDSRNHPHIVFYADDLNGVPQYQHLRYDGRQWHHQIVSARTQPFTLKGDGTLQIPISRPEIILDRSDNAFVITRGDHSQGRIVATLLAAPDYTWDPMNIQTLWNEDLGFAEPIIDRERWAQDNILSLLLQYNEQPDHDIGSMPIHRPVRLIDICFMS